MVLSFFLIGAQFQAFRQRAEAAPAVNVAVSQANVKPKSPSQQGTEK